MDNVNKANVMLTLQKETEKFLLDREKSESLTFSEGKAVSNPSALGDSVNASLDNHYRIGFKKAVNTDGTETISAIIVEKKGSGSDVKAAKIANMIGISAVIKSAMNDHHAYGIKGLWKEQLSDYGITNVPAGSAVVTTKYNKNKKSFYFSDMIIDSNIDMDGRKFTAGVIVADKVCIGTEEKDCRNAWSDNVSDTDLILLKLCYSRLNHGITDTEYCQSALNKGIIDDCSSIAEVYFFVGIEASSGYYYLGSDLSKKVCYFKNGAVPTLARQVIEGCNDHTDANRKFACMYDFQTDADYAGGTYEGKKYTQSCQSIYNADNSLITGYYTITSSYSEVGFMDGRATPCVFATGYAANNAKEVIRQCSRSTAANYAACARAYIDDLNGNCEKIKLAGENFTNFYKFTVVASKDTTNYSHYNVTNVDGACYFVGYNLASSTHSISVCNALRAGSLACGYELDAYRTVVKLKQEEFPNIRIVFVIANTPELQRIKLPFDDFVYPPKAETENKRWCIVHRNNWIVDNTDFVIAYNRYHGRAFKLCESADRKGVKVIELAEKFSYSESR